MSASQAAAQARDLAEAQANHADAYSRVGESGKIRDMAVLDALGAGWTQRQVAHAMGVSAGLVGRIAMRRERG